jgi:hypothetical protein
MAYDEKLAARVRDVLSDQFGVVEKKMFGGLAFMWRGLYDRRHHKRWPDGARRQGEQ